MIPISRPWLGEEEKAAAIRPLASGWVTQGPEVAAFEREFCAYTGAPHACAVSSGTTALHLALLAAGVQAGDEVITVSHSFIATANVIRYCGAIPVFVDIDPATFNIDPTEIEAALSERTRAILCVHQIGMPCDIRSILAIARSRGITLIEDAACAIGSEILWDGSSWERIGKPHADIACFSFHPRKLLTTGDGGMLTTANPDWDASFRLLRQHGMSVPDTRRHSSPTVVFESYPVLGYNFRLTDIQAAIGREQLKKLPAMIERRVEQARRYQALLAGIPGVRLPLEPEWARTNWQSYCVWLPEESDQTAVMQSMLDEGVSTRRGVQCAHREPAYPPGVWRCPRRCPAGTCRCLVNSERAQDYAVILPLFHDLTESEQETVAQSLRRALAR